KGIFCAKQDLNDSAIYYYKKSKSLLPECDYCDNNIGHMYLVTMRLDSATAYFKLASEKDPKSPFPNFNLGTIETLRNNYVDAIERFTTCIDNSTESQECIVTHMDIYFNKAYTVMNEASRKSFSSHVYIYKIQYMGYLSILYAYLRD